jgi:hypothetical protein
MAAPTLDARLLCACNVAYSVSANGAIDPTLSGPFWEGVGWTESPVGIVSGPDAIDACVVGVNQDGIVVAFRGTIPPDDRTKPIDERVRDWCQDFRAELVVRDGLPGKVHAGFLADLTAVWDPVQAEIQRIIAAKGKLPLNITGHSKGASVAFIAAMDWHDLKSTVVTFAAARPGNDDFAKAFDIPTVRRYEYWDDIVPHLPPHTAMMKLLNVIAKRRFELLHDDDYSSAGPLLYIHAGGSPITAPLGTIANDTLWVRRFSRLTEKLLTCDFSEIVAAHSIGVGSGYQLGVWPGLS